MRKWLTTPKNLAISFLVALTLGTLWGLLVEPVSKPKEGFTQTLAGWASNVAYAVYSLFPGTYPPEPITHRAKYEVSCCDFINLTYLNASGGQEQSFVKADPQKPWTMEFLVRSGQRLYLSAQSNQEIALVMVALYLDGDRIQSAQTSRSYGVASVGGIVP